MGIKLADSLEPMTSGFPAAYGDKIWLDKNKGEGEPDFGDLQKMYEDGELGGGGGSSDGEALGVASAAVAMAKELSDQVEALEESIPDATTFVKKVNSLPENPTEGDQVSYNGYLYVATKTPFCYCWKNSSKTLYTVDSPELVTKASVLYESSKNPPTSISDFSVFSGTITSVSEDKASIVYNGSNGVYYTENENGFEIVWKKSEIDTGDVCKTFGYPSFDFKKSDITSPGSFVRGFFSYNQELYAITNSGVSYWTGSQWSVIDSGTPSYPVFFKGHWFFSYSTGSSTDPGIKKLENNHTLSVVTQKSEAGANYLACDDFNLYVSDGSGQKRSTNGITWTNQAIAMYEGIAVVVNDDKKHFAGFFVNARGPGDKFAVGFGSDGYVTSWSAQTGTFSYPFKIDNKIYVTKNGVFGEMWFCGKNTSSFEFKPIANAPAFARLWKSGSYYFGIDSNNYFYGSSDFKNWTKVDRVSISGVINSPNCYGSIGDTVYFCTSDGIIYESTGNTYPIRDMQDYIEKQTISKDPFGRKMSIMPLSWKVILDFANDSLEETYWKLYNMYYSQLEYSLAFNMVSGKIESALSSGEAAITTAQMSILNASYGAPIYQLKVQTSNKTYFIRATLGADYDLSMYELSTLDDIPTKVTILYDYNHSS